MNVPSDHVLLHYAMHVVRARRADAEREALLATAGARPAARPGRPRRALALACGRAARLLAALAEDLDPAVVRPARS